LEETWDEVGTRGTLSVLARQRSRSQEFFDASGSQWDTLRDELFGSKFHLSALMGLIPADSVVGDLGAGTGTVTEALAPFVGTVIGVDASKNMLAAAAQRLQRFENVELRHGELTSLPINDGRLDAATLKTWKSDGMCKEGACVYASTEITCPKGCQGGMCVGAPCLGVVCDNPGPCEESPGVCDEGTGKCLYTPKVVGSPCDPGDKCIPQATCDSLTLRSRSLMAASSSAVLKIA